MMLWQRLQKKLKSEVLSTDEFLKNRPILFVDTQQQLLSYVSPSIDPTQNYPISTSKFGLGQQQDSYQTPAGIHKIAQKIGAMEPLGRVFKAREPMPEICLAEDYNGQEDIISTRILWLEGLQPDLNCGGGVDSFQRYIYIHGTPDEEHIGQPASIGCVRMRNLDILELFDQVEVGDLVVIE